MDPSPLLVKSRDFVSSWEFAATPSFSSLSYMLRPVEPCATTILFLNIHTYAEVEGYPTWKRSYPEDPKLVYLKTVERMIRWRDRHAPGKEIRITEFGWDASTKKAPATGTFAKWVGSTETEQ